MGQGQGGKELREPLHGGLEQRGQRDEPLHGGREQHGAARRTGDEQRHGGQRRGWHGALWKHGQRGAQLEQHGQLGQPRGG